MAARSVTRSALVGIAIAVATLTACTASGEGPVG